MRAAAQAGARRATVVAGGRRFPRSPATSEHGGWRRYGPAVLSILLPLFAVPLSFFVWYALISLGAYPGNQAASDLIVGVLYTALVHAILLAGILLAVSSIQARRREGRLPIAGWIGVVLNAVVLIYWQLLVSPWLVVLWNRVTGS
ncbi:hypothetical protein C5E08_01640 [Rathayibacter iranicus]|uniref:Uncharacterized protein n=3 Tax=Rathayibacter iranicus TaxID=59737 RepID=A0AAD2PTS4_9MICO|nr:hypothetical protein C7V51_01595 [Rathayibacter iranicus]PPI50980.1 hypothetical protein C5E09_01640 [Rathayibacter iranicus]PPI62920.1 hypothetical protein C5E08_01640 [Rathayibacter iranicus]PPI74212.1 hypothetical protein C5E01_01620 [Rathayibacter iranicus]PWJ62245.1 hypothetical protein B0H03_11263 [Rathayibacter iranicus NCPPB 2253 = VKM Ac-1602]